MGLLIENENIWEVSIGPTHETPGNRTLIWKLES